MLLLLLLLLSALDPNAPELTREQVLLLLLLSPPAIHMSNMIPVSPLCVGVTYSHVHFTY